MLTLVDSEWTLTLPMVNDVDSFFLTREIIIKQFIYISTSRPPWLSALQTYY